MPRSKGVETMMDVYEYGKMLQKNEYAICHQVDIPTVYTLSGPGMAGLIHKWRVT